MEGGPAWLILVVGILLIMLALAFLAGCADQPGDPPYEVAIDLVRLTSVDGQPVDVNPGMVTALRGERKTNKGEHFTSAVKCLVYQSDGKFIPVIEDCETVQNKLKNQ